MSNTANEHPRDQENYSMTGSRIVPGSAALVAPVLAVAPAIAQGNARAEDSAMKIRIIHESGTMSARLDDTETAGFHGAASAHSDARRLCVDRED